LRLRISQFSFWFFRTLGEICYELISNGSLLFQGHKALLKGRVTNFNDLSESGTNSELMEGTIANLADSTVDGWDIVEHPRLPPPSRSEDVEHWTRAMFIDATK
jgi:hypothetical protein